MDFQETGGTEKDDVSSGDTKLTLALPVSENESDASISSAQEPITITGITSQSSSSQDTASREGISSETDEDAIPNSDLLVEENAGVVELDVSEAVTKDENLKTEVSSVHLALQENEDELVIEKTVNDELEKEMANTELKNDAKEEMDIETVAEEGEEIAETDKETEECSEPETAGYYYWNYDIDFEECTPKCLINTSIEEFKNKKDGKKQPTYLKGCKWAPDGSCLLSNADDDYLRLFNIPTSFSSIQDWNSEIPLLESEEWCSTLKVKEGGLVYDYCWYPLMSSMDPVSSCFLTSSSEAPIHLWDAFTGSLRASYQPFNHLEQLLSAYSLAFDPTGVNIYCGFEKSVRIFNITRPGKQCVERSLKQNFPGLTQFGKISTIAVNPSVKSIYAVGSLDKTIGLYYDDGSVICLLQGHLGGVTHMKFSNDGLKLFTGGRKDSRLICWDMRNMEEEYQILNRQVTTHQRMYFDVTPNGRHLVTGGTDGVVRIWDLLKEDDEPFTFKADTDCVNGISLNPFIPLLATSSGQRYFLEVAEDSDDDEMFVKSQSTINRSCDIKLWKVP